MKVKYGYLPILLLVALIIAGGNWLYGAGWDRGRADLINNPTRSAYGLMGYGWDESDPPAYVDGTTPCWKHLDGNGMHCGGSREWHRRYTSGQVSK